MKIEQIINQQLNKYPPLKRVMKRAYQSVMYSLSPKIKSEGNIVRISPDDPEHEYFFGYYDKSPWDKTGRYMLCMRAKDTWSDVSPHESADILLIDTEKAADEEGRIKKIACTDTWNVQQACMLQWLGPDYSSRIIYNDFRSGKYVSVILTLKTMEEKIIDSPVYSVSGDGKFALTLDFSRLYNLRPGYGYYNVQEETKGIALPDTMAIWKVDLQTGKSIGILKYTDFAAFMPRTEMNEKGSVHKVNHIMISPDGKRFMVLYRWFIGQRKYSRLITCNIDGSDMYVLSDDDMVSHCCWKNNEEILAFENKKNSGPGYYLMKDKTQEYIHLWERYNNDGHPSYSPDGKFVVTDSYPDRARISDIKFLKDTDIKAERAKVLARVFAPFRYDNDVRCDLHPRWSRDGRKICFDSVFEGHRGLYTVKIPSDEYIDIDKSRQPEISVIIPVYNSEKYLKRCVDSVRDQTYKNLEIILVDDGSKDKSGEICDSFAKADKRIKVIHNKNSGQAGARNSGVDISTGEYIGFVDSDDWIHPEMFAYLLSMIENSGAQASQIGISESDSYPYSFKEDSVFSEKVYKGKDILQHFMLKTTSGSGGYSVCRCLFSRNVLNDIRFREGKINEDIDYKYRALSNCSIFCESERKMYCYFQSTGSTTTDGLKKRDFDLYDAAEELYRLTKDETYGDIRFLGEVKKARTPFSLLCKIARYGIKDSDIDKKSTIRKLTEEHRANLEILLKSPLPLSRKLISILLFADIKCLELPLHVLTKLKNIIKTDD